MIFLQVVNLLTRQTELMKAALNAKKLSPQKPIKPFKSKEPSKLETDGSGRENDDDDDKPMIIDLDLEELDKEEDTNSVDAKDRKYFLFPN